jgi:hypothetical protein
MITTGVPFYFATKTEIVDVVSGEICADLADFPLAIKNAVGANLNGTPVVCGGENLQTCYKYTIGGWQGFASMKEKRGDAAGVMFQNKFHIFGGYYVGNFNSITGTTGRLQTSELISIDGGVEYGPELPTGVGYHAITSINSTVSILSGGYTGCVNSICHTLNAY